MALNIPSLQQLATPVSSARRADIERRQARLMGQEEEMNALQLEAMRNPQPDPKVISAFMDDAKNIASQMVAYEDALKEKDLSDEDRDALLQRKFTGFRQMISERYGEQFGASFDDDAQYDSEGMRAWLGQIEESDEDFTLSPGAGRYDSEGNLIVKNPSSDKPQVQITMAGAEDAATEKYGASIGERAASRDAQAEQAANQNANLQRMLVALERGAATGLGEETLLNIKSLASTFLPIEITAEDSEQEIVRKISNEMALMLRNPDSGLGLTGNTSNRDLQFLKDSVAGLQRTEEGNRLIIDYAMRINNMKRDIAAEQSRLIAEAGKVPADLDSKLMTFVNNYQLFNDQERALIEAAQARTESGEGAPRVINFNDLPN